MKQGNNNLRAVCGVICRLGDDWGLKPYTKNKPNFRVCDMGMLTSVFVQESIGLIG